MSESEKAEELARQTDVMVKYVLVRVLAVISRSKTANT